jgi:hypothetical protein
MLIPNAMIRVRTMNQHDRVTLEARAAVEDRAAIMNAAKPLVASGDLAGAVRLFMDGARKMARSIASRQKSVK